MEKIKFELDYWIDFVQHLKWDAFVSELNHLLLWIIFLHPKR
jgi:hypothetical protein